MIEPSELHLVNRNALINARRAVQILKESHGHQPVRQLLCERLPHVETLNDFDLFSKSLSAAALLSFSHPGTCMNEVRACMETIDGVRYE